MEDLAEDKEAKSVESSDDDDDDDDDDDANVLSPELGKYFQEVKNHKPPKTVQLGMISLDHILYKSCFKKCSIVFIIERPNQDNLCTIRMCLWGSQMVESSVMSKSL